MSCCLFLLVGLDGYRYTHSGIWSCLGPRRCPGIRSPGSPVQMASPGQWENFPGDLGPSGRDAGPHIKTCHSQQFLKLPVCEEPEEREKEGGILTVDMLSQTLLTPDQRRTKPAEGLRVSNVPEAPRPTPGQVQISYR